MLYCLIVLVFNFVGNQASQVQESQCGVAQEGAMINDGLTPAVSGTCTCRTMLEKHGHCGVSQLEYLFMCCTLVLPMEDTYRV